MSARIARSFGMAGDVVITYAAQAWIAIMGVAFVPVYIRYLGIEAYGLIGLFATLQAILVILDLGMSPTIMREIARFTGGERDITAIRDLLRSVEIAAITIGLITMAGVWAAADWFAHSWIQSRTISEDTIAHALTIMGVVSALRFVEGIFRGAILGLQRQVIYNLIAAAMATLRGLGVIIVLATVSNTVNAFFAWQGVISLVTLLTLATVTYRVLPPGERAGRFSVSILKDIWRFAAGMLGISVLAMLLTQIDKILLSRLLSLTALAHYMLAALIALALETLVFPLIQAVAPRLSRLHAEGNEAEFTILYHLSAQIVSTTAGAAALVLIGFPNVVLLAWTQDTVLTAEVAPLLRLLALGYLLNILLWIPYQAQLAYRWTGLTLRMNMVAVILIVPALIWAVPRYGPVSAALAWVALNGSYIFLNISLMHRRILTKEKGRWYREDVAFPLAAAATALAILYIIVPSVGSSRLVQIAYLATAGVVAVSASALAAPILRNHGLRITTALLRRKLG